MKTFLYAAIDRSFFGIDRLGPVCLAVDLVNSNASCIYAIAYTMRIY